MKRTDWKQIIDTYSEVKSYAETARLLGLNYNTVRKVVLQSQGLCICRNPIDFTRSSIACSTCLDKRAKYQKAKYKRLKEAAICVTCGQPLARGSTQFCTKHLALRKETIKRFTQNHPNLALYHQHYNYNAEDTRIIRQAVERANHSCEICGNTETRLQAHHVDLNQEHHTLDNLIVLCFFCHRAVHNLLRSLDGNALMAFVKEHYLAD